MAPLEVPDDLTENDQGVDDEPAPPHDEEPAVDERRLHAMTDHTAISNTECMHSSHLDATANSLSFYRGTTTVLDPIWMDC